MSVFGDYAALYDAFYTGKDYKGEMEFVLAQMRSVGAGLGRVLELGCGTGRYTEHLAASGCDVTGVDLSGAMLEHARKKLGARADFFEQDLRNFRGREPFDAAIALFHVFSYLPDQDAFRAALSNVAANLKPGGWLFFDFWNGPGVLADPPQRRAKEACMEGRKIYRNTEPNHDRDHHRVEVVFSFRDGSEDGPFLRETHIMRYLFQEDLEDGARHSGLLLAKSGAWLADLPPDARAWNAWALMQKP